MDKTKKAAMIPPDKLGIALLAAACAVLVLAYFATLAGLADGTIDMSFVVGSDTTNSWIPLQAVFHGYYSFWQSRWGTANAFLDIILIAPFYWLFGYVWGIYLFSLFITCLSAAGWILLSSAVFGKSAARAAFVIAAHSLPLLYMGWFGGDIFYLMLLPTFRFTPWSAAPWLLWLAVRCLQTGKGGFLAALAAATAFMTLSNQSMIAWFCAPLVAALLIMLYADGKGAGKKRGSAKQNPSRLKTTMAAVVIGTITGRMAASAVPFAGRHYSDRVYSAPEFGHIIDTIGNLLEYAWIVAKGNPISAMVWLAFVVVAGRGLLISLRPKRGAVLISVERRVLFLFVPLAMAATFGAIVATGLFPFWDVESFFQAGGFDGKRYMEIQTNETAIGIAARYLLPVIFLPLFFGWVLYMPTLRPLVIGISLALMAALAIPKAASLDFAKVNPYSHPFYDCLHEAAEKYNAKGVISAADSREVFAYPHWQWDSYISAGAARGGENSFLYMDRTYRFRIKEGSFDFVISNADKGKFSYSSPGREPRICDYGNWHQCVRQVHPAIILDGQAIRGAFGEPQNIIHCPGNSAIYHYDPPIVIRDIVQGKQAGERFNAQGWTMPAENPPGGPQ